MSKFLNAAKQPSTATQTTNGAKVFSSSGDALVDFFGKAGALRGKANEAVALFSAAYNVEPLNALRVLFFLRDVRGGQGEREAFRQCLKWLVTNNSHVLDKNMALIAEFGRWDDVLSLLPTKNKAVQESVLRTIGHQLKEDLANLAAKKPVSLLAKWMPSENASSKIGMNQARFLAQQLGYTPKQYRVNMTKLRKAIHIVETPLTEKNYQAINYQALPGRASSLYRNTFLRSDETRYRAYLGNLKKGTAKINSSTRFPYEMVKEVLVKEANRYRTTRLTEEDKIFLNASWDQYPDFIGDTAENAICVVDTSSSMHSPDYLPISASIATGLYYASKAKGPFKDHFITFNTVPALHQVFGSTFVEKVTNAFNASWGGSTNLQATFELILSVGIKHRLKQEEMPNKLYIVSDMQFNKITEGFKQSVTQASFYDAIKAKYQKAGYEMPTIVFWNVNATNKGVFPASNGEPVQYVSGLSPAIFKYLVTGNLEKDAPPKTARELVMDVVNSERYSAITV